MLFIKAVSLVRTNSLENPMYEGFVSTAVTPTLFSLKADTD